MDRLSDRGGSEKNEDHYWKRIAEDRERWRGIVAQALVYNVL